MSVLGCPSTNAEIPLPKYSKIMIADPPIPDNKSESEDPMRSNDESGETDPVGESVLKHNIKIQESLGTTEGVVGSDEQQENDKDQQTDSKTNTQSKHAQYLQNRSTLNQYWAKTAVTPDSQVQAYLNNEHEDMMKAFINRISRHIPHDVLIRIMADPQPERECMNTLTNQRLPYEAWAYALTFFAEQANIMRQLRTTRDLKLLYDATVKYWGVNTFSLYVPTFNSVLWQMSRSLKIVYVVKNRYLKWNNDVMNSMLTHGILVYDVQQDRSQSRSKAAE